MLNIDRINKLLSFKEAMKEFKITGLINKSEYKFYVKLINQQLKSEGYY